MKATFQCDNGFPAYNYQLMMCYHMQKVESACASFSELGGTIRDAIDFWFPASVDRKIVTEWVLIFEAFL